MNVDWSKKKPMKEDLATTYKAFFDDDFDALDYYLYFTLIPICHLIGSVEGDNTMLARTTRVSSSIQSKAKALRIPPSHLDAWML